MIRLKIFGWIPLLLGCCLALHGQSSVLRSGPWFKVAVSKNGVYRISHDLLKKMGLDPAATDPRKIAMFGREGGMLPQPNAIARPTDLVEIAILVSGEADGRFDKGDYILFYAHGPDRFEYDVNRAIFHYENNLYSEDNFYFLTVRETNGKRIAVTDDLEGSYPVITTFDDVGFYEKDEFNIERSGREWFGEKFGAVSSHTITFDLPGIVPGSTIRIVSDVMGQTYTSASLNLFFNNVQVGEQNLPTIPNGRYSVKGLHRRDTLEIAAGDVNAPSRSTQELKYEFIKGTGFSQAFLDFALVNVKRHLAMYGDQTIFRLAESLNASTSTFRVKQVTPDSRIWDVTDHDNVRAQEFTLSGSEALFSAVTDQLREWVVFRDAPEPVFISRIDNQNLSALAAPNLLIISHPDFREEAERLASHRQSFSNWSAQVVTTEEIYHEFSGGRQDVTALRDFVKTLWDKNPETLRAVLLFGRASYDYKDRLPNNTNFVPTYQSRNSLHPLQTYSSDDYFGFLEDDEGSWSEAPAEHHTLDVGVGRIPVTSREQARDVVDKIIYYDTNRELFGSWRKKVLFVADDGNSDDGFTSLHQYQADQLATAIELLHPDLDPQRMFMGSYQKNVQPNGETVPGMVDDIKRAFQQGTLIINFTGHGSELVWTDERVLTEKTIEELANDRYPFLVTATCEFGRQDDPMLISTAERSLTKRSAGSIGLVTTARPVNATTNFDLNEAFYDALLQESTEGYRCLGEVFMQTKNNSASGVANRNFSLIGDPSMTLALPEYSIKITSVKTALGSDTLKALSTVIATGEIHSTLGVKAASFNGIAEATLYDKPQEFVTIGKNNPAFEYQQWNNALFRGKATVKDGEFSFTFVMPRNIAYQVGGGKFSLYAFDEQSGTDAKGVENTLQIGGTEKNVPQDVTPPIVRVYMGDTTFTNGGITSPDTDLIVYLSDENGINISGYGIGNSIRAELDGGVEAFALNDYYATEIDTYQKGWVKFPLLGLAPGKHTVTVTAWDVYNNSSAATIDFLVTDGKEIVIETFGNFPNPFQESSTLFFTHNRSGDDLAAQVFIYNPAGRLIHSSQVEVASSGYRVDLMEINTFADTGKKLLPGLYLARVIVRSLTNGSKNEKVTKLIVLN